MAIDIETTGLDWTRCGIVGIGSYSKEDKVIGFSKELPDLEGYETIMHNGSFDVKVAKKAGIEIPYDHDTILMASLVQFAENVKQSYRDEFNERKLKDSLALDNLAIRDLGIKCSWKIDWDKEHPEYEEIREHCLMDCRVTYYLFEYYKEKLVKYGLWNYYTKLLMPLARLLVDVECNGIRLDVNKLSEMKIEYKNRLDKWSGTFHEDNKEALAIVIKYLKQDKIDKCKPGKKEETLENRRQKVRDSVIVFNPNSSIHMTKLLKLKGISLVDRNGKHTTASKLLYRYKHDKIIGQIIDFKKTRKIYKDFLCKWDDLRINDILHTNFRLWATRTGRLSSAEPNLQQVPKGSDIRGLFIPRNNMVFTVADAKQLEARLAAFYSNEEGLIQAFKEGVDVYSQIAKDLMDIPVTVAQVKTSYPKERQVGKQLFLASIYGQGSKSLHYILTKEHQIDISLDECKKYKRIFNKTYSKLKLFSEKLKEEAEYNGFITTWFGRKIFIPHDKSYKAINSYVQGSGSDIIGFSQLNIVPNLPNQAKLLLLVHDEILIESLPEDVEAIKALIHKYMEKSILDKYGIYMEMEIKTGMSWGVK